VPSQYGLFFESPHPQIQTGNSVPSGTS